jgi:prepilin-type N-terminal cleavage/methylation domain-containing protein
MKTTTKGFTLVELLAVIAIIGILASVVLVSLRSARDKAQDVKVISAVKQLKTIVEGNYSGIAYSDLTNDSPINGGFVASGNPGNEEIGILLADALALGSAINVVNDPNTGPTVLSYAIYGQLISTSTKYFCLDSTGASNQETSTNDTVTCPQ